MAIGNAKVGFHTSSTGGGGILTVYDRSVTKAAIRNTAYYDPAASGLSSQAKRTIQAISDFIAGQQEVSGTSSTGVIAFAIGSNGTDNEPFVATINAAGRVQNWTPGS